MTITFFLKYHSSFGQRLYVMGDNEWMGDNEVLAAVEMTYFNEDYWKGEIHFPSSFSGKISYRYILKEHDGLIQYDAEEYRYARITTRNKRNITLYDTWNDASNVANLFFTSAFKNVLLPEITKVKEALATKYNFEFRVKTSVLKEDETVCLCGSTKSLRNWNTENPILLHSTNNWFIGRLTMQDNEWPASYKYGIYNLREKKLVHFEEGENRSLERFVEPDGITIIQDSLVNFTPVFWRGTGVNIPVFSLRAKAGWGVGEFVDLKLLVDWAKHTGLQLIQLLPVNDTSAYNDMRDSYPYAAISAFALHPLYINLDKVAGKEHEELLIPLRRKKRRLNALPQYDYQQVMKMKLSALRKIYEVKKESLKNDLDYFNFFELNREWLVPYAVYCWLRDRFKTPDHSTWPKYSIFNEAEVLSLATPGKMQYDKIAFYYFVQYHLHLQLKEVKEYARKHKIVLKGDVPIGVYRNGCDTWQYPQLFHMEEQAGAPPDSFAKKGQNWGFPTYNWGQMQLNNFDWWHKRFDQMSVYFDAFRIDHILGFFRIWSVPYHAVEAILGRFVPVIPIHISEFAKRNIWFDYDRYCNPFIHDDLLYKVLGSQKEEVQQRFLNKREDGRWQMNENVNTQRKVADLLTEEKDAELKQNLFDLISNVILLEKEQSNSQEFHFRILMDESDSFSHLDPYTQHQLKELYNDYFFHIQDKMWKMNGMQKLAPLKGYTDMLVFGEDLGMVPKCVNEVMDDLAILSIEVERMPKAFGRQFSHPNDAPYLSDVTPSTHDMSTIRGWWQEDRGITQTFYNNMLGHYGEAPYYCEPWINKEIVVQHLHSPAMWCIFLWQDLIGMNGEIRLENPEEERINIPSDPNHYWGYRIHIPLEDLIKNKLFNNEIKTLIDKSGRGAI